MAGGLGQEAGSMPRSPNTVENAYSTFEVTIPAKSKNQRQDTDSAKRFTAFAASALALTLVLALAMSQKGHPTRVSEAIRGVSEREELGSVSRAHFLQRLEEQFPEGMRDSMNFSVDPCSNFYEYACGQWIADATISADQGSASKAWDAAENNSYTVLRALMEDDYPEDSEYKKVHDWYASCMDLDRLNELGAEPLRPYLEQIDKIETSEDLWKSMAFMQLWSIPTMITLAVNADEKQPRSNDLFLDSGGLILPDVSYYDTSGDLDDATTATNKRNMELLSTYIKTITQLAGYSEEEAIETANRTVEIEQMLAQFQSDEPYSPDTDDAYLHYNMSQLRAHAPDIPWDAYFDHLRAGCAAEGLTCLQDLEPDTAHTHPSADLHAHTHSSAAGKAHSAAAGAHSAAGAGRAAGGDDGGRARLVMDSPYFYSKVSEAVRNHSAEYWAPYLRAHVIYNLSPLLSQPFLDATFAIDSELEGVESSPPRWKKCVSAVKHALPGVVDRLYVENVFPPQAKKDAEVMMEQLRDAFIQNLASVDWMDASTRAQAVRKAEAIEFNIGSPSHWPSLLDSYAVAPGSYFHNSMQAYHRKVLFMLTKLSRPVDRHEWTMKASTVNAYYDNGVTALFVPAAMLQPPFFSASYPPERNFGGIGTVMGHEFTHGFDDTGRKYDARSRLREWWAKPAVQLFQRNAQCISSLYGGFALAGESLDGNNTLGENIADEGGVKIAMEAYERLYKEQHAAAGRPAATAAGPSERNRRVFFTAFAQNWCDKERLKTAQMNVQTDEHSPSVFRVNGVISQNPAFAKAFQCPAGAPMDPVNKCVLWSDVRPTEELVGRPEAVAAAAEQAANRRAAAAAARARRSASRGGGARADFDRLWPGMMLPDIRHR